MVNGPTMRPKSSLSGNGSMSITVSLAIYVSPFLDSWLVISSEVRRCGFVHAVVLP